MVITAAQSGPVDVTDRVEVLDVLRGVALFGVFLVNFIGFAGTHMMATEQQLLSLPSVGIDAALRDVLAWLALDKANTLFAFLFGLGFYLQMQRLEARGVDFEVLYRRRLTVLLLIGVLHMNFLWTWDILHLYALAGFILLPLRRLSARAMLIAGLVLALLGRTLQKALVEFGGSAQSTEHANAAVFVHPYQDSAVLERQRLSAEGDYFGLVETFFEWSIVDYIASGLILGWLCYALGRFLLGAWVGRHEWITRSRDFLPGWRRLLRWALPAGLIVEGIAALLMDSTRLPEWEHREFMARALHLLAVPVLSAGYVAAVVVGFESRIGRRLLAPFAWAGRMALTNYLMQSFVYGFVLFGVGPGLALAGKIGTTAIVGIVVVFFAMQIWFSRWWLGRWLYGPIEWVWRALTYGEQPALRRTES